MILEISLSCKHWGVGLIPVEIYSCVKSWKEDPDSLDLQRDTLRKAVRGIGSPCPFYLFLSFIYLFSVCAGSFSSCSERGLLSSPGPRASRRCGCFSMPSTGSRHASSSSCLQPECRDSNPNNQTHTHTHEVLSMEKKHPILTGRQPLFH